jgi:shikimate kinase
VSLPSEVRRIVLVGFMGSGKSTVGPLLAASLGWRFVDFDATIEADVGLSVAEIFRTRGEAWFRSTEERVARDLLVRDGVVLGSGGGWGASAERLRRLPAGTASVWLRVSAEEAVRRTAAAAGERPLLDGTDPLESARRLLEVRAREYAACDVGVDTNARTPKDVVEEVVRRISPTGPFGHFGQTHPKRRMEGSRRAHKTDPSEA